MTPFEEIMESIKELLRYEHGVRMEIRLKQQELEEIKRKKVELALIIADADKNELVRTIIDSLLDYKD